MKAAKRREPRLRRPPANAINAAANNVEESNALNIPRSTQRKWSDGGGTGLVQWTGDLGPGLQIEMVKETK